MLDIRDLEKKLHSIFATWMTDPRVLLNTLVGREELVKDLLRNIRETTDQSSPNHVLIIGPRGIGKTHVLSLIHYFITGEFEIPADFSSKITGWISLFFSEEEYVQHDSLATFLDSLFQKLNACSNKSHELKIPEELWKSEDRDVWKYCFDTLDSWCKSQSTRILLVIDNVQKLIPVWSDDEQSALRAFLTQCNHVLIVGSSISIFNEIIGHNSPFFEFFEIRIMRELTHEEMLELLRRRFQEDGNINVFEERKDDLAKKIPAIELLTGGNPRLVMFLYDIVTRSEILEIESALKRLLEDLREYFISRLNELPEQQRKILDTIAQMEGPSTPTEIAEKARIDVSTVNGQLKRLKEKNYIKPVEYTRKKITRYDIKDRLFRIWRQTATNAGRIRFKILVEFLRVYYSKEEIENKCRQITELLSSDFSHQKSDISRLVDNSYYFMMAAEGPTKGELFYARHKCLIKLGDLEKAKDELNAFKEKNELAQEPFNLMIETLANIEIDIKDHKCEEALSGVDKLIEVTPEEQFPWMLKASILLDLGKFEQALEACEKACEVGPENENLSWLHADVSFKLKKFEKALIQVETALRMNSQNHIYLILRGLIFFELGRLEDAFLSYKKASDLSPENVYIYSMLAETLLKLERIDEAMSYIKMGLKINPESENCINQLHQSVDQLIGKNQVSAALDFINSFEKEGIFSDSITAVKIGLQLLMCDYINALEGIQNLPNDIKNTPKVKFIFAIVSACRDKNYSSFDSLPTTLLNIDLTNEEKDIFGTLLIILSENHFERDEFDISIKLFSAFLKLSPGYSNAMLIEQIGDFFTETLDIKPSVFCEMVKLVLSEIKNEEVLSALNPYIQAVKLLETKDLTILEKLFPEVQELVVDIISHIDAPYAEKLKRIVSSS